MALDPTWTRGGGGGSGGDAAFVDSGWNRRARPSRTAPAYGPVPRKLAARYFPDFFLRAAQYAVIRSDTAFFSSGVI